MIGTKIWNCQTQFGDQLEELLQHGHFYAIFIKLVFELPTLASNLHLQNKNLLQILLIFS